MFTLPLREQADCEQRVTRARRNDHRLAAAQGEFSWVAFFWKYDSDLGSGQGACLSDGTGERSLVEAEHADLLTPSGC
jgi:hypothetical protein